MNPRLDALFGDDEKLLDEETLSAIDELLEEDDDPIEEEFEIDVEGLFSE